MAHNNWNFFLENRNTKPVHNLNTFWWRSSKVIVLVIVSVTCLHVQHALSCLCGRLLTADFAAAAVLISFGAVLGKTSALQLVVMTIIEVVVFGLNERLGVNVFGVRKQTISGQL